MNPQEALNILGLHSEVTIEDVKTTFWRLAKLTHPDVNKNASATDFIRLREAQEVALKFVKTRPPPRKKPTSPFRIYRLISPGDVCLINGMWSTTVFVPPDFAAKGGLLSVMGYESGAGRRGYLLPEFRLNLTPFTNGHTIIVETINPKLKINFRIREILL